MNILLFKKVSLYFFACQKMRVVHVLQCECGGQKVPSGNWYPPPTMWVSGIKLRTPDLAAIPLPAELSHQP